VVEELNRGAIYERARLDTHHPVDILARGRRCCAETSVFMLIRICEKVPVREDILELEADVRVVSSGRNDEPQLFITTCIDAGGGTNTRLTIRALRSFQRIEAPLVDVVRNSPRFYTIASPCALDAPILLCRTSPASRCAKKGGVGVRDSEADCIQSAFAFDIDDAVGVMA